MPERLPSYEKLCRRARLALPQKYHEFLKLCVDVSPDDPWTVFEAVGLFSLGDGTPVDPGFSLEWSEPPSADAPPELVVFAESGGTGLFHGFFIEDTAAATGEHPVVTVDSPAAVRLAALTFSSFLEQYAFLEDGESEEEEEAQALLRRRLDIRRGDWSRFASRQDDAVKGRGKAFLKLIRDALDSAPDGAEEVVVELPGKVDDPKEDLEDSWARRLSAIRVRQGCAPTADGIGLRLPDGTVDREFVDGLRWPARDSKARRRPPDYSLLTEAGRRLARREPGTALVIAKSLRHIHWYDDWKAERRCLRETGEIMEESYRALGRAHAAQNVRVQTEWALENVT